MAPVSWSPKRRSLQRTPARASRPRSSSVHGSRPQPRGKTSHRPVARDPPGHQGRLVGNPHRPQTEAPPHLQDRARKRGMEVHVVVGVDMIECQPGSLEGEELASTSASIWRRARGRKKKRKPARTSCVRNSPRASTRSGTSAGGSTGRPSTSTRCSPTRRLGRRRARARRRPRPRHLQPSGWQR